MLRWSVILLVCLLGGSLAGNVVVYRQLIETYRQLALVRLYPLGRHKDAPNRLQILQGPSAGKRIVFFGDSRIQMWHPLPVIPNAVLINSGIGSQTTAQCLVRIENDVVALKPELVVIQVGINDLKYIGLFPNRQHKIIDDCLEHIQKMLDQLAAHDIEVVLLTVFPVGPIEIQKRMTFWSDNTLKAIKVVNTELRTWEREGMHVMDCNAVLAMGGRMKADYVLDSLHLTTHGYEALNSALSQVFAQTLTQKLSYGGGSEVFRGICGQGLWDGGSLFGGWPTH